MSTLDTIKRTAYNAADDIVAVQTINVTVQTVDQLDVSGASLTTPDSFTTKRFKRVARIGDVQTVKTAGGASGTIARITTTGRFTSHAVSGNDVTAVTYAGGSLENDIVIPVGTLPGVLKVGDTV